MERDNHLSEKEKREEIQNNLVKKWVDGRPQREDLIEWMIPKISYNYKEVSPNEVKVSNKQYKMARASIIPVIKIHDQNFWFLGSFRESFKGERILSDFGGSCKSIGLKNVVSGEQPNYKSSESPLDCALRETKEETKGLLNSAIEKAIKEGNYIVFEGIEIPNKKRNKNINRDNVIYFYFVFVDYKDIKDLPSTYLKAKRLVKERLGPLGFYLQSNILNRVHRTARNLTDFVSFLNNYKR